MYSGIEIFEVVEFDDVGGELDVFFVSIVEFVASKFRFMVSGGESNKYDDVRCFVSRCLCFFLTSMDSATRGKAMDCMGCIDIVIMRVVSKATIREPLVNLRD
mmetsp:Transcript_8961/g.17751  ORF Transcript_8961/g.17751 Transcript_8961/m.17751 type:complete len:103 (+) Transcript_8961:187-495(+)